MQKKLNKIIVIKIGGSTLGQHDTTLEDLVTLQKRGIKVVVIHGGGKIITEWLAKQGASTKFVQGERVTDKVGLEVATAVLCGVVNKQLVADINISGGKAVGLSGVDGCLLEAKIRNPEQGYIGQVIKVNVDILHTLLIGGYIPVISSVSINTFEKPVDAPSLLNVNADTAAGEIAAAIEAGALIFLTDIAGICDKSGQVIQKMSASEAEASITSGVASGGMIPKIRAGIRALVSSDETRIIDGRQPHALLNELENRRGGTTIYRENK
jgi:acetylglutamate kinase